MNNNLNQINWKVLLVDDDEDDYLITRQMLSEAKLGTIDLEWASSYGSGRESILQDGYDAVLMDYDLGTNTGIELIREAVSSGYKTPIILLTGRGSYEVDLEAMQAGATLYLTKKEANPLLLERCIRYAIDIKDKEEELHRANSALLRLNENLKRELFLREKTERALALSEERYRSVFEHSLDVAYRRNLQTETYDYMSPVVEQVLGFTHEEMLRMSNHDLAEHIHPEDLPMIENIENEASQKGSGRLDYRFRNKNGHYMWLADYFSIQNDENSKPLYRGGIVRDVTLRKNAELERDNLLKETEEQRRMLETVVENLPAGMAVLAGPNHRYQLVNSAQEAIARGEGQLVGRKFVEVWPEAARNEILPLLDEVYVTGNPAHLFDIQVLVDRAEGKEEAYFNFDILPIKDEGGNTTGVLLFSIETTAHVLARKRLEEIISRRG